MKQIDLTTIELDREPKSPNLYINWYDPSAGRQRRKSTGTADVRLAQERLGAHFYASNQPETTTYSVPAALVDYWLMHDREQKSSDAIKARLKLFSRFLDHEVEGKRLRDPITVDQITDQFIMRFRRWALADPIVTQFKSRPRSPATVEESVIQLKAALNFAVNNNQLSDIPRIRHKARQEVTPRRNDRMTLDGIAKLRDFTTRSSRYIPLRRYTIAAINTSARLDNAIFDVSVAPARGQWRLDTNLLDLNPAGRLQTTKRRDIIPASMVMQEWLAATKDWFVCTDKQVRVASVRSAWDTARTTLGIPEGRGPKYLRHSVTTILANRRVPPYEISLVMGHQVLDPTTETYFVHDPLYLQGFLSGVEAVMADLDQMVPNTLHPNFTRKS